MLMAVGLAVAAADCAGSSAANPSRAEATAVIQETHRFVAQTRPLIARESKSLSADFDNCSVVKSSPHLPPESALQIITFVGTYKQIAVRYAQHAERLRRIASTDPVLRQAASFAVRLAARYRVLSRASPGYCRVLQAWQAAGWRTSFDIRPVIGVPLSLLDRAGFDRSAVETAAHNALSKATFRLQQLGTSRRDAKEFATAIDLFFPVPGFRLFPAS